MTGHEERAHEPLEHDPTGVRALLAGLPDPGPMPADVEARILAALRAEGTPGAQGPAAVVPLAAYAPRRRPRRLLTAVAGIAAAGLAGLTLAGPLRDTVTAALGGDGTHSSFGGAAPEGAVASDRAAGVTVVSSGRDYTPDALVAEAAGLDYEAHAQTPRDASGPAVVPASPTTLDGCLTGLGVGEPARATVDLATYAGRPALVVVATDALGRRRVWATARTCSATDPGVVAGPLPLP